MQSNCKLHLYIFVLAVTMSLKTFAFPAAPEDDRYVDREFASPGGHQLASWLISKLRKAEDFLPLQETPTNIVHQPPYRLPLAGKRNSELTSVMMGFPKSMMDNGR